MGTRNPRRHFGLLGAVTAVILLLPTLASAAIMMMLGLAGLTAAGRKRSSESA